MTGDGYDKMVNINTHRSHVWTPATSSNIFID